MNIFVYGAGVIGSVYAHDSEAGYHGISAGERPTGRSVENARRAAGRCIQWTAERYAKSSTR